MLPFTVIVHWECVFCVRSAHFWDESIETLSALNENVLVTNGTDTNDLTTASKPQKPKSNETTEIVEIHPPPSNWTEDIGPDKSLPPLPPPLPPPPPPLQSQTSISSASSSRTGTTKSKISIGGLSNKEQMQEELKFVLSKFLERKQSENNVPRQEFVLDQYSSPSEVHSWLNAKGFSEKTCKQLRDMTGSELFDLTRRQMEQYCGSLEGSRLYSQIALVKTESEKKNPRTSELKEILDKARHRAEKK